MPSAVPAAFMLTLRRAPRATLFPYTTLFRSLCGPALRGCRLPLGGVVARVARDRWGIRLKLRDVPQAKAGGRMRKKKVQQPDQIVRLGHRLAQFFQERLEELLACLLAMETAL